MTQSSNFTIKPLQTNHFDDWLPLWQAYLTFYETTLENTISDNTWQNLTNTQSKIDGFGAWLQDEMVGFVHTVRHPNTWNTSDCCYLEDLFVSDNVRGQGMGRALIQHVYAFANDTDCNRVYWTTQEHNLTARRLYDTIASKTDMVQYRHNLS